MFQLNHHYLSIAGREQEGESERGKMGMCDNKTNLLLMIVNGLTVLVGLLVTICGVLGILNQSSISQYSGGCVTFPSYLLLLDIFYFSIDQIYRKML